MLLLDDTWWNNSRSIQARAVQWVIDDDNEERNVWDLDSIVDAKESRHDHDHDDDGHDDDKYHLLLNRTKVVSKDLG